MSGQLPGTANLDSLNLAANLTVGGTAGITGALTTSGAVTHNGSETFAGNVTFNGSITYNGTAQHNGGNFYPVSRFIAAGTVTFASGYVDFNASVAGFNVQLPAPAIGADFDITCHTAPSSGVNKIVIPAGGTIYNDSGLGLGPASGSVLSFGTAGQAVRIIGLSSTQYQIVANFGTVPLS